MSHALWYTSRATGLVSLLGLTMTMVLGLLGAGRAASPAWPRFVIAALHRNTSLLLVAFLALHIATAIVDPYAGIRWIDAVLPFTGSYKTLALGLGAVAFDLLIALIVTSLLRTRLGLRTWRAIHFTAYACWPVAVVHGYLIGGTDRHLIWVLGLDVLCILAVLVAVGWRVGASHPDSEVRV